MNFQSTVLLRIGRTNSDQSTLILETSESEIATPDYREFANKVNNYSGTAYNKVGDENLHTTECSIQNSTL